MTQIINHDADFLVGCTTMKGFPHIDEFAYLNFFAEGVDARRNLATGAMDAVPVGVLAGEPGGDPYHWIFTGMENFIQTAAAASPEFTFFCVAKPVLPEGDSCPLISNLGSASIDTGQVISGAAMYLNDVVAANNLLRLTVQQAGDNAGTIVQGNASTGDINVATAGDALMYVGRCDADRVRLARIMGTGAQAVATVNYPAELAQPYIIGGNYNGNDKGPVKIYMAGIVRSAMADTTVSVIYNHVRTLYLRRGITI
ncbi:hypothetical protein [Sphingobium sp. RAC03]|uniref:hypothetical protein n=1 Tax=Sphingobium sp. RAC03 TaxID=1843368 RepID=UPI00083E4664|nr:hypothetical protein [Sphingobium sp. RAC03]AOF97041.1 hypothetical protein BSY17_2632 [Sphingobium sp. RAC03]